MISPRQALDDNMRPAELLLRVYRLLECDQVQTDGELVTSLRRAVGAVPDEGVMLIYNEIFLGLVRERAQIPLSALKRSALDNLLRQSVVAACTALDVFLPSLLRLHLPTVIEAKGRDFFPDDEGIRKYFEELTFGLSDTLRLLGDPDAPLFIANKILGLASFKYLSSKKGVFTVAALLSIDKPWDTIADHLGRDRKDLPKVIQETTDRRNNIVHRADRLPSEPDGSIQPISYAWTLQAVDTIKHVCLALDELVAYKMVELKAVAV